MNDGDDENHTVLQGKSSPDLIRSAVHRREHLFHSNLLQELRSSGMFLRLLSRELVADAM